MPIYQSGTLNTTALVVPDLYVQIVAPQNIVLNGTPTNVVGVVGTAIWGPVGIPVTVANMQGYVSGFGTPQPRKYDMGTQVATAIQQGASNFRCVRATDGTDAAATSTITSSAFTATALYTGTLGNSVTLSILRGTAANSFKVQVGLPGQAVEQYDNIQGAGLPWVGLTAYKVGQTVTNGVNTYICSAAGTSAATTGPVGTTGSITDGSVTWAFLNALGPATTAGTFWANVVSALNNGTGPTRGASALILATGGAGTSPPPASGGAAWVALTAYKVGQVVANGGLNYVCSVAGTSAASGGPTGTTPTSDGTVTWVYQATTYVLAGGLDGATAITAATLIGQDFTPRRGMYALRSQGCSIGVLADADDSTQWTTQAAFGLTEGVYMITVSPSGDTIANAVATKQAAGLDSYAVKHMFGDWIGWNDPSLGYARLVSPQGFAAGRLANLSPEQSSLNKPIYSIAYTQRTGVGSSASYSSLELGQLFSSGIEVISNPQPSGSIFGCRSGHNSSSNAAIQGDNYTRLTNYIASTFNQPGGLGNYEGQVINAALFQRIRASSLGFLQSMLGAGQLGSTDGSTPFSVICDLSNNPPARTQLGYVQTDISVQYQWINEKFLVNVQGGQTVTIQRQTTQSGQVVN